MDKTELRGKIKIFLSLPFIMIIPLAIIAIVLGINNDIYISPLVVSIVIYTILSVIIYYVGNKAFMNAMVDMAISMESAQKTFLEEMPVPYAIIDKEGGIYWYNLRFKELTSEFDTKVTPVTTIFKGITVEKLKFVQDKSISIKVEYKDRVYNANIEKLSKETDDSTQEVGGGLKSLYAMMLLDETQTEEYRQLLEDEKLVVGNIYIDNYEEALNNVDEVKRSLLEAVVERRIRKYFSEADAIIRKIDRDKYFVIFPNKYMEKLMENRFSILEGIKNTKVGNDTEITISVGLGLNGDSFSRVAEYARSATSLALGRGGSQVVIKNAGEVSIYGAKGKEVEKNTRVKARVKAQALRELIANRDRVIVMGHKISDFDSLGAAVGIYCMAREAGKPCNIVLNTINTSIRPMLESLAEDEDYPKDLFVKSDEALELYVDGRTLVVVVDTNIPNMTECPELLEMTNDIVVFDHHRQGIETIKNPILSYVETYASSTSEMVAEIGQYFSDNFKLLPKEADCIYTGMLIDTNNFMTKTGVRTFEAAAYLRRSGADVTRVRKLLREDINSYKMRAETVRNAQVYRNAFAIAICDPVGVESPTILGAQVANELLNILGIKASFVLTLINDMVYISSRSIDEINVQVIMEKFGGGGHLNAAGAQIEHGDVDEVKTKIQEIIDQMIDEGEIQP